MLTILRGLPASGKTTWARQYVADDPDTRSRVNRDDLRALLHGGFRGPLEQDITRAEHSLIDQLLRSGRDVVVDNLNLRKRFVRQYLEIAGQVGVSVEIRDFPITIDEAAQRDAERAEGVGVDVIRGIATRFLGKDGSLPPAPKALDYEPNGAVYEPRHDLVPAVIVDIDGTVALHNGRSPHDYSRVSEDLPNQNVIKMVESLHADRYRIVFLSGRPDSCRDETKVWINKHVQIGLYAGPFMRSTGDHRDDTIVKRELFDAHVRDAYNVVGVLDDRNRVVRMWRRLGLTTLQVAEGNF